MQIPTELSEQIQKGNVVLFCGAGISMGPGGLPSGWQLTQELAQRAGLEDVSGMGLPEVAQAYELELGHQSLIQYVINRIDDPKYSPLRTHQLITALPFNEVITTNWDNLLEEALRQARQPFVKVVRDADIAFADEEKVLLIKLHGSIEQKDTIVITGDDYYDVFYRLPEIAKVVGAYFATRTLLFMGFGLADEDFRRLYHEVVRHLGRHKRRAYAVQLRPRELDVKYWEQKNVQVIDCDAMEFLEEIERGLQGTSAGGKQVWFDQSHNQHRWDWGPLPLLDEYGYSAARKLAEEAGYKVAPLTRKITKPEELTGCDLLVIVAPYHTHLQPSEIRDLVRFVENGGSLLVMSYYTGDGHHESNLSELAKKFGVEFNHDQVEDTVHYHHYHYNIIVENIPQQPEILQGVGRLCFPLCCSLKVDDPAQVILRSGPHSYTREAEIVDRGRIQTWTQTTKKEVPLVALSTHGAGRFAAIGTWEVFLSDYMDLKKNFDNAQLYLNLLQWLTSTAEDGVG